MIGFPFIILSLIAGMFLLAKVQKEGLNLFFKIMSWFIVLLSTAALIVCTVHCSHRMCYRGHEGMGCHARMEMRCGDSEDDEKECCKEKAACAEDEKECKADSSAAGK